MHVCMWISIYTYMYECLYTHIYMCVYACNAVYIHFCRLPWDEVEIATQKLAVREGDAERRKRISEACGLSIPHCSSLFKVLINTFIYIGSQI